MPVPDSRRRLCGYNQCSNPGSRHHEGCQWMPHVLSEPMDWFLNVSSACNPVELLLAREVDASLELSWVLEQSLRPQEASDDRK